MCKQLLLALLLSLALRPAAAQHMIVGESRVSQEFKQHLREQYASNDTAQAIINLYCQRQSRASIWILGATTGSLTSVYFNGTLRDAEHNPPGVGTRIAIAALAVLPVASYGVAELRRYSNAHLNQVLTAYATGQPLPRSLRRKLKRRFFQSLAEQH
ncbi:MAG: hypothetical protein ACRYFX_24150 [Janthinobacterium lividum]